MFVTESIVIAASPPTVWDVAGDPATIAEWSPALDSSRVEGDRRYATFAGGGGDATERIVEHDDAARSYTYEYLSGPLPLRAYRSTISVNDHASGSEVVWTADFSADDPTTDSDLATAISDIYQSSLQALKTKVES